MALLGGGYPFHLRYLEQTARHTIAARPMWTPPSHFPLIRSRQGAKGGCCGWLAEGIAALLGSENGWRYRGVSQLQSHQSRYSVQLRSLGRKACLHLLQDCSNIKNLHKICDLLGPLQESFGPFGPEIPKKSKKRFPGPLSPEVKKGWKKSKKGRKRVKNNLFSTSFRLFFFNLFWPGGREAPGTFFRLFQESFGPFRAWMTPVRGQEDCNTKSALRNISLYLEQARPLWESAWRSLWEPPGPSELGLQSSEVSETVPKP